MMRWQRLLGLLVLAFLSALAVAKAREAAMAFTATTLSGDTFTNDSLKGQVTLLQFWTTWCPYCRREQPIVENLAGEFSGQGLVVLAVDVGEPGPTVKKYLDEHPRSCQIVLTEATNLVAEYSPRSFPLYVVIDRDGNVAGVQHGAAGDVALRRLLGRAGLGVPAANVARGGDQRSPVLQAANPGSGKIIEVPAGPSAPPAKPLPPTVFVLSNGERLEAHHYTIIGAALHIVTDGKQRTIPLADLDRKATLAANHERGIELKLPTRPGEIVLGM